MKICFLLGHLTANGGIGRATSMLANQIVVNSDIQCTILSYYNTGNPLFYEINPKIKLDYLQQDYTSMTKFLANRGYKKLESFLKKNSIDILIACGALFFPVSVLATKNISTRCICWEHTAPELNSDYRGQALARKFGIKRSDLNVVLTKRSLMTYIEKFKCRNTLQIYNPIDPKVTESAKAYRADSKRIISVGRLSYPKNFGLAIEVATEVLKKYPDWTWDIYGEGDERPDLEKMIIDLGLEGRVILRGQVNNLYELYNDYSFMVMTSRYEGFPMSLLEGLGNGLPLVSFDIETGPNEIIQNEVNGFLLEIGNKDGMAEKIEQLISDQDLRIKMSNNSQKIAKRFSISTILNQWVSLSRMM